MFRNITLISYLRELQRPIMTANDNLIFNDGTHPSLRICIHHPLNKRMRKKNNRNRLINPARTHNQSEEHHFQYRPIHFLYTNPTTFFFPKRISHSIPQSPHDFRSNESDIGMFQKPQSRKFQSDLQTQRKHNPMG